MTQQQLVDPQSVSDTIRTYLETEYPNQDAELTNDTNLLEEWFVDSLAIVEIVMYLEKQFGIKVGRADITGDNFENVNTLASLVVSRSNA